MIFSPEYKKTEYSASDYPSSAPSTIISGEGPGFLHPGLVPGSGSFPAGDLADLNGSGHWSFTEEMGPLVSSQKNLSLFPPLPPKIIAGGIQAGNEPAPFVSLREEGVDLEGAGQTVPRVVRKNGMEPDLVGKRVIELGSRVFHYLLEVFPLRSTSTGKRKPADLFPLPTSKGSLGKTLPDFDDLSLAWMQSVCVSLNSLWGDCLLYDGEASKIGAQCLQRLGKDVKRLQGLQGTLEAFSWSEFFMTRGIDYKGDEVRTARAFEWRNIEPALPREIGRVPLEDVCTLGAHHYVVNFDLYLKDRDAWTLGRAPRVMVADEHWPEVCTGLLRSGVCTLLPAEDLFDTGKGPLLNGLFGVTKEEWAGDVEVYRLIMNLIPLNNLVHPLRGDVNTLPMWSMMNPFFIQPGEQLLNSSEDVRCFFYTMAVPPSWWKYLGFNKRVPDCCLPAHLQGREVYLASKVLPMGFLNSVSLAQHVHRNLALWSGEADDDVNLPENEIRKDRSSTVGNPSWRIYLDNYDLLEGVKATGVTSVQGSMAPSVLALRNEYEKWEVPRNLKKSVSRALRAEVQGAQVDGEEGVAYPRESKLLKYIGAAITLVREDRVSQKQLQVVCGGLVYFSMFRRPLLGCLNAVWALIESFNQSGAMVQPFPDNCKAEIMRLVALVPLARLDFRLPFHEQVTCSDASSTGGGICASAGISRWGQVAALGKLRGELPELRSEHQVLTIGLFDGIAALRVAADLLGLHIIGHVSVEIDSHASRVVESHFPEVRQVSDVQSVDVNMVREWSREYSQASVVLIGGGPPCQGVSGLNVDRRGALRDERSKLFVHVPRIATLVRQAFPWCQAHSLMESVASMDQVDRECMSETFGCAPWKCDAGTLTWCSRPRLYWLTWDIAEGPGVVLDSNCVPAEVVLHAWQDLEEVCQEGWIKVDPSRPYPTFTTSRPRVAPGRKPAGISQCTAGELERWRQDKHRFPPYQYTHRNLVINRSNEMRLPSIQEKEYIMGFPIDYTLPSVAKGSRGTEAHLDVRHSLIGNSWSVPVIAWLLAQLFGRLGLCPLYSPQDIVNLVCPSGQVYLQSRLWRRPLRPVRGPADEPNTPIVHKLANLISVKGEDILLSTPSSQLCKYHRLRASVPARIWRWRVVTGWKWRGQKEHINSLELRAVLTSMRWRIQHRGQVGYRFLHLTDSLVVLHSLSRGRSSSRKLRSSLSRINALLLCSSSQALWGYVHTAQNPADKPSRWGRHVKTKFRYA